MQHFVQHSSLGLAVALLPGNYSHFQGQSPSLQELSDFHCILESPGIFDKLQAPLRDSAGSVPDDPNNTNIATKQVTQIVRSSSAYKSYVCTLVYEVCNSIMSKKKNVQALIKKILLTNANHHLTMQTATNLQSIKGGKKKKAVSVKHNKARCACMVSGPRPQMFILIQLNGA